MKWKHRVSKGRHNCMFQSIGTAMSTGVRKEFELHGLKEEQKLIQSKAKKYGGIDKVQVFKSKTTKRVLLIVQRYSEDDVKRIMEDYSMSEDDVRFENRQFILFADEYDAYLNDKTSWLGELSLVDMLEIHDLTLYENRW